MAQMTLDTQQGVVVEFGYQSLLDAFHNFHLLLILLSSIQKVFLHEGEYLRDILTFCSCTPRFAREKGDFTYECIDRYLRYVCR